MEFLALVGIAAIAYFVYSSFSGYQRGQDKAAEMTEVAFTDYMKIKTVLKEWHLNPDDTDLRDRAIYAGRKYYEIISSATFNTAATVKTKEDAIRFTYCKQFVHLKAIDEDLLGGTYDYEFPEALVAITEIDMKLNYVK
jgi:hypothetical protein